MTEPTPMSEVFEDELLLDLIAARADAGSEPVAEILGSLAAWSDQPIGPTRRTRHVVVPRRWRPRRAVAALGLIAVGLSGAGVAAAMTRGAVVDPPSRNHRVATPAKASVTPPGVWADSGPHGSTQPSHAPVVRVPAGGATSLAGPESPDSASPATTSPEALPQGQQAETGPDATPGAAGGSEPAATGGPESAAAPGEVAGRPGRGNGGQPPGQVAGPGTPATGATGNGKHRGRPSPTPLLTPQDGSTGQRARSSARTVSATDTPAAPQTDAPPQP